MRNQVSTWVDLQRSSSPQRIADAMEEQGRVKLVAPVTDAPQYAKSRVFLSSKCRPYIKWHQSYY